MRNPFFFLQVAMRMMTIEITLGTSGITKVPDQPQLENTILMFLEAYNGSDIATSPVSGSTMITAADFGKCNLLLVEGSEQKGQNIPLPALHQLQNSTPTAFTRSLPKWVGFCPSWTKCQVIVPNGQTVTASTLVLNVAYCYPNDIGFKNVEEYKRYCSNAVRASLTNM